MFATQKYKSHNQAANKNYFIRDTISAIYTSMVRYSCKWSNDPI